MKRKIIEIDRDKCNGCGLCVDACHEAAIVMVDGKAELISDEYCDGLGDCLPECPTGAITMVEKETVAYDEAAVEARVEMLKSQKSDDSHTEKSTEEKLPCGCPGSMAKSIEKKHVFKAAIKTAEQVSEESSVGTGTNESMLATWPVQLNLVPVNAPYLKGADLLIAADCSAYAYADFHKEFIAGRVTLIGCPKLDDNDHYREKLAQILKSNDIKSITVVRMEVPCCGGIIGSVKGAMLDSETIVPYKEVTIGIDGTIK